ncbi:retrovirus-related pol polyprotein from transposon TNT 1-94 [Tanacetum coccineum]
MRVESINGKKYILVIVNDYSKFTLVKFLRSKDESPEVIIRCLNPIQVCLNATVKNVRTDNGTEFVNQTLKDYYENVEISHQTFVVRTLQQNGVVERQNRTLVEATRTMLIFSKAPLYFFGYAPAKKAFTIYNRRTRKNMEIIHVTFDELITMASEQFSSGPSPQLMTPGTLSSGLVPNPPSLTTYVPPTKNDWDILFQPMFDEFFNPSPSVVSPIPVAVAQRLVDPTGSPMSTSLEQDAPSVSTSSNQEQEQSTVISKSVEEQLQSAQFENTPI